MQSDLYIPSHLGMPGARVEFKLFCSLSGLGDKPVSVIPIESGM